MAERGSLGVEAYGNVRNVSAVEHRLQGVHKPHNGTRVEALLRIQVSILHGVVRTVNKCEGIEQIQTVGTHETFF